MANGRSCRNCGVGGCEKGYAIVRGDKKTIVYVCELCEQLPNVVDLIIKKILEERLCIANTTATASSRANVCGNVSG